MYYIGDRKKALKEKVLKEVSPPCEWTFKLIGNKEISVYLKDSFNTFFLTHRQMFLEK